MVELNALVDYCNNLLEIERFQDYCPNGLQLQGGANIRKLVSGVTASQALIDAAVTAGADALLVHHGFFWRGEDPRIVGMKQRRIKMLLDNGVSLLAYHLPLDAHPVVGNNAQFAEVLGLSVEGQFGREAPPLGRYGRLAAPLNAAEFALAIEHALQRKPLHIEGGDHDIQSVAWCTGAAQNYIEQAAELGVDAFVSGEISEQTVHVARECGLHYFAAGHHASERGGVRALGEHLAQEFDLQIAFIDIANPV